jgi:hypothetical protein
MGMETIPGLGGYPNVFGLDRDGDGLWLDRNWADPEVRWDPYNEFVFRLRKSES